MLRYACILDGHHNDLTERLARQILAQYATAKGRELADLPVMMTQVTQKGVYKTVIQGWVVE